MLYASGTTTATVLARAIFSEGAKSVAAGMNPMDLRRGINMAVEATVDHLKSCSKRISTTEEISQVGTISANGESSIGALLAKAMERVGKEGVITVQVSWMGGALMSWIDGWMGGASLSWMGGALMSTHCMFHGHLLATCFPPQPPRPRDHHLSPAHTQDGKTLEDELEVVEGMKFDRGYISPYFVTDPKTMKADFEDALILIHEKKISGYGTVRHRCVPIYALCI